MADNTVKKAGKAREFFKGIKSEFKKIVWPSFKTITNNTGVVIAVTIVIGLIIFVLDWAFSAGFMAIFGR